MPSSNMISYARLLIFAVVVLGCEQGSDSKKLAALEKRVEKLEAFRSSTESVAPQTTKVVAERAPEAIVEKPLLKDETEAVSEVNFKLSGNEKDDPFLGSSDAQLLLVAFFDFNSAASRRFASTTLKALRDGEIKEEKLRFILRDFPLSTEEPALSSAITAHCLGEQGRYWDYFDRVLDPESKHLEVLASLAGIKREKLLKCQESNRYLLEIDRDIQDARAIGARGAPSFFLGRCDGINCQGKFIRGAQPLGVFRKISQELLAQ